MVRSLVSPPPIPAPPGLEVLRSARTVSGGTLLSRVFGLLRDTALAHTLGAGAAADAFAIAFRIPNLLREILGEGALTSAFLPAYAGHRAAGNPHAAHGLFRTSLTLLAGVLLLLTLAATGFFLLVPPEAFGSDDPAKVRLTLDLAAWCFPYALLVCASALFAAVLQAEGRFAVPALAPAAMNIAWVGGIFLLLPLFPATPGGRATAVAAAVLVGGAAQVAVALPLLARLGIPLRPALRTRDPALRTMLRRMGPAVLGLAPVQANLLVNALLAEAFIAGDGANSALYYSSRILQLPLALIGVSVAVASFPLFSRLAAEGKRGELGRAVSSSLRATAFLAIPAAAGLAVLALPVASVLFRHGRFTGEDAAAAAEVLRFAVVGLPAFCGLQVMTRAFHASGDTATPVRVGAWSVAANFAGNLLLVGPLGAGGLAFSTALVAWGNLAVLVFLARNRLRIRGLRSVGRTVVRTAALSAPCVLAAAGAAALAGRFLGDTGFGPALASALLGTMAGAAAFALPALAIKDPEALRLKGALLRG